MILAAMKQRPIIFNSILGGMLCASSDALAQHLEKHHPQHQQEQKLGDDNGIVGATTDAPTPSICNHNRDNNNGKQNDNSNKSKLNNTILAPSMTTNNTIVAFDWYRFGSAGVIGTILGGGVYPMAYAQLDAMFVARAANTMMTQWWVIFQKSVVEILTVGVFVNATSVAARGSVKENVTISQVLQHLRQELPTITQKDIQVWLPYNLVAFSVIPPYIRPTTTAMMEACWQTYISWRSNDYSS